MPRIAPLNVAGFDPRLKELFDRATGNGAHFSEQFAVMAHVRPAVDHLYPMLQALKARGGVSQRHLELAIVVVSQLNECTYCVDTHGPRLSVEGISPEGVQTLLQYQDHPELSDADKVVVEYAMAVTRAPQQIRDGVFKRLHGFFDDAQIVELTLRIALCGFFNRFNQALQIGENAEASLP
jgi:uncharacterized peroxidase-related enzyme